MMNTSPACLDPCFQRLKPAVKFVDIGACLHQPLLHQGRSLRLPGRLLKEIVTKRFGFNNPLFREFGAVVNNFARNTVWNAKETARQAQASSLRRLTGRFDNQVQKVCTIKQNTIGSLWTYLGGRQIDMVFFESVYLYE
jgi:hypothetical protein